MESREVKPLEEIPLPPGRRKRHVRPDILENLFILGHNDNMRHQISTLARACANTSRTVSTLASRRNRTLLESVARIKKMRGTISRMEAMIATGELPRAPENEDTDDDQEEKEEEEEEEAVSVTQIEQFIDSFYKTLASTEKDIPSLDDQVKESRVLEVEIMTMIAEARKIKRSLNRDDDLYRFDLMHPRLEANEELFSTFEALSKRFLSVQRKLLDFSESVVLIQKSEPIRKVNALMEDLRAATLKFGCPRE